MKTVTLDQVRNCLQQLPIREGDGLLVHSALQFLGKPVPGPEIFLDALLDRIGPEGTLAAPAFNFDFCKGQPFNRAETPSKGMGVFSELVRMHPDACRTPHPMQSLAVLGEHSPDLCGRDTPGAFDDGSAFERMLELDFKLLLLGAPVQSASIVHFVEQRHPVPYRYWKTFSGEVIDEGPHHDGGHQNESFLNKGLQNQPRQTWRRQTWRCQDESLQDKVLQNRRRAEYRMFVRDEALQPELRLEPIEDEMRSEGLWFEQPLNYGAVAVCSLLDFVSITARLLRRDPWALIINPPRGSET